MNHPSTDSPKTDDLSLAPPVWWHSLRRPLVFPALLLLLQLLGARAHAVVLSGTVPLGARSVLGLVYVAVWFVCIVAVPPWVMGLLLGRAALLLRRRLLPQRRLPRWRDWAARWRCHAAGAAAPKTMD